MSNRNFDSRVIIQRLQNQNYARNLYQMNVNGQTLINNPQHSDGTSSRLTTFTSGSQTNYFRGLLGAGETVSLGGTFDISAITTASAPPPSVPSAATITQITEGNLQLSVAFSIPTSNGGASIIDYEYSIDNGSSFTSAATTTSPFIITGLTNGVTYQVVIRAVNTAGSGASSTMVEATPSTLPSPPTSLSVTPGNTQLTVSFTAGNNGGSVITNYEYSLNNGSSFTSAATTTSPFIITGLTNGVTYQVVIRAVNAVGSGASSTMVEATPSTLPSPPTGLSGTPGDRQLTVSFTAGNNGGSAITNYQYSTDNGATFLALNPVDASTPITITKLSSNGTTDLTNGTPYTVRLKAVNANGASVASSSISVTPILITVPPEPTSLSGIGGNQAVYVLFTQTGNGGSAITNYEYSINGGSFITCSPAQTFSPVMITTSDGTTPLANSTSYTVTLKAVNSVGSSIESASTSITPTATSLNTTNLLVELDANNSSSYSGSGSAWTNLRSSGSYSATLQNAPSFDGTNKYFTFNGTNQIAEIAQATAINPTAGSSFTIQIWARVNTASPQFNSGDGLISKQYYSPSYDGYSLSLGNTGGVTLNMNGGSVNGNYSSSAGVYSNGWALYTIVVRFGGGAGNPSYAYVSTRRVITAANAETSMPSQAPLQFPRGFQDASYNFCPADVGAFYLYNTALSQADIIRNYDATKTRYV